MDNHFCSSFWIFILSVLCLISKGEAGSSPAKSRGLCTNGIQDSSGTCICNPCWDGQNCDIQKNTPQFNSDRFDINVNTGTHDVSHSIITLRDEITTCGGSYSGFSISSEKFTIDRESGNVYLTDSIHDGGTFEASVKVHDDGGTVTDSASLVVTIRILEEEQVDYEPKAVAAQSRPHHRSKRATTAAPSNVTFTLVKQAPYENTAELWVGSRVKFQLNVSFPTTPTTMLVELFTPDNDTTVMILCDVVATKGTGLDITGSLAVTMDSKTPGSSLHDRAILDLGTVTVTNCDSIEECTLVVTYEAIMVDETVQNGSVYWVSAGAEYNNANEVWVGQASFATITDALAVPESPAFNFTGPTSLPIGSAAIYEVEMYLPYPSTNLAFDAFAPLNTSSVMSICSAKVKSIGENLKCGLDESAITTALQPNSNGLGNTMGHVDMGKFINKVSREGANQGEGSTIRMEFAAHLYNDATFVGQNYWLGSAFEIGSSQIWAGQLQITGAAPIDPTGMSAPVLNTVVTPDSNVNVDVPKIFLLEVTLPESTTANYELKVTTPVTSSLPEFQLCRISIKSVGGNMPCVVVDDKTPVYVSTVAAPHADQGTLNLGSISNLPLTPGNATESSIVFEIIVTPLTHTAVTTSSNHDVTMTLTYGAGATVSTTQTFTVQSTSGAPDLSNTTVPSFNMTFAFGNDNVDVGAATKVYYDVTTNRDVTYPKMNIEAIMPLGNLSTKLSICRARMTSVGRNLPCVEPEWINSLFTYSSRFNEGKNDRAILNIPKVCNKEEIDSPDQDLMRFEFDIKVEDHVDLVDNTKEWVSAGNMYSDTKIWVGQLALYARRPAAISPTTSPYISLNRNSSFTTIPIGMPVVYSLLVKVYPGESIDLNIDVNSVNQGLSVCGIRLKEAGDNFPCANKSTAPTFTQFANGGNTQGVLNFGVVTNTGSTPVAANDYFDSNSLIFEIIVKLSSDTTLVADAQQFPFTAAVTTTTNGSPTTLNGNIQATYNASGFDSTITQSGTFAFSVGEIAGNDSDASVAKGEGKRFIVDLVLPESVTQKISVSFLTPVLTTGQVEICDVAVINVGAHYPCIDKTSITPIYQSRPGSLYNDIATVDLGYVCSSAVVAGAAENNKIQIEAVARVLPDAPLNAGDGVYFHVTVTTNDAQIYVAQMNMTIADKLVEKQSLELLNNNTLLEVNLTDPTTMAIGEVVTFPLVMNVPAMSVSNVIVDVSLPANDTAVAIVKDMRLVSAGRNVKCLYENATKNILHKPVFNSSLNNCENNKAFIDFGIVTNAGLSYRREDFREDDNTIVVDVDVVLNDNEQTENGAYFQFSFGAKLGSYIFIIEHNVTVSRTGTEMPVLDVQASVNETLSTSTFIVIDAILTHANTSTAAAVNASVMFYLPPYLLQSQLIANASSYTTSSTGGMVSIDFDTVIFCDVINIELTLIPNTSISVPEDILTDVTVVSIQAGTFMTYRVGSSYTPDQYFVTDIQQVNFTATVVKEDVCGFSLGMENGRIDDCQIFSSVEDDPARPAFHGRMNGASAWSPFQRGKLFDNLRFFQVYFGNKTLVTKIVVQQPTGFTHYPTKLTLTYSDDGYAWQDGELVTLIAPFTNRTIQPTRLVEARYLRIYITEDNAGGFPPDLGVQFGLFGCYKTSDAPADMCSIAPQRSHPTDYFERSFAVGNGKVIVCDVNPKEKDSPPMCHSSTTGSEWTRLSMVGSVIGYDPEENKWFGYGKDKKTTLMSVDGGITWQSTSRDTYLLSRDKASFLFSKKVPWQSTNLDNATPHLDYQISGWGATFNGMMKNSVGVWTSKLDWDQCCV